MTTNRFVTIASGVRRLVTAISASAGAGDANKIVATNSAGRVAQSFLGGYILICEQQASGTNSGASVAGIQTRVLNTELVDTLNLATLSGNQVTLLAGTYRYRLRCPCLLGDAHTAFLYNVSTGIVAGAAGTEYANSSYLVGNTAETVGRFTIASSATFEVRHSIQTAWTPNGLGVACGVSGKSETYTVLEFWNEP